MKNHLSDLSMTILKSTPSNVNSDLSPTDCFELNSRQHVKSITKPCICAIKWIGPDDNMVGEMVVNRKTCPGSVSIRKEMIPLAKLIKGPDAFRSESVRFSPHYINIEDCRRILVDNFKLSDQLDLSQQQLCDYIDEDNFDDMVAVGRAIYSWLPEGYDMTDCSIGRETSSGFPLGRYEFEVLWVVAESKYASSSYQDIIDQEGYEAAQWESVIFQNLVCHVSDKKSHITIDICKAPKHSPKDSVETKGKKGKREKDVKTQEMPSHDMAK